MPRPASSKNRELAQAHSLDFLVAAERAFNVGRKIEMPPVIDFVEHSALLNRPNFLFPRQKTFLKLIFLELESMTQYDIDVIGEWAERFNADDPEVVGCSPDVWQRIDWLRANEYAHFREVVNIIGRRGSKGLLGGIIGAWMNWRLIQTGDPQAHYGVEQSKDLYLYVTASGQAQAIRYQFADLANTITTAPCFTPYIYDAKPTYVTLRTDADARRAAEFESRGLSMDRSLASIINIAVSANSQAARGGAAFCVFFDEMAQMIVGTEGPRTADAVYRALTPSLGQMHKDAFIYVASSPYQQIGKFYSLYLDAIAQDGDQPRFPDRLAIQLPSWGLYKDWDSPHLVNVPFVAAPPMVEDDPALMLEEKRDPETFRVEIRSQFASVISAWLSAKTVEKLFEGVYDPELGGMRFAEENLVGVPRWIYRGHADPGWASDNFAVAIGHSEPILDLDTEDVWYHVFIDWMKVWKPSDSDDHHVDYIQVQDELVEAICRYPNMQIFSLDQYSAMATLPQLRKELTERRSRTRVLEETATVKSNRRRAEVFKSSLNQGWIHAYRDEYGPDGTSLLEQECKFLQVRADRIDHQRIGPVTTKDLFDAVSVVCEKLLGDQLERLRTREALGKLPLAVGAQGGYHTQPSDQESAYSSARKNLNAWSQRSMGRHGLSSSGKPGYPGGGLRNPGRGRSYIPWGSPR